MPPPIANFLETILSTMNLGVLFADAEGSVAFCNDTMKQLWFPGKDGVSRTSLSCPVADKQVHEALSQLLPLVANPNYYQRHLRRVIDLAETLTEPAVYDIPLKDGRIINEQFLPVRNPESGVFIGYLWLYAEVTKERKTAEQMIQLAERDQLTGLYNRHKFNELLEAAASRLPELGQSQCAVLFFDIDDFKGINDTFGHRAGDDVLTRVAGELSRLIRRTETFARLGGDEFAILLPECLPGEAEALAERVVHAISRMAFRFDGKPVRLTSSLGLAYYPQHALNSDDLVAKADIAMYQAKDAGKNTWRVYKDAPLDLENLALARLSWNERISRALDRGLFRLHYQGVYDVKTGKLAHLEALARLVDEHNPTRLISPGLFITEAEKSGRILDIDRWVVNEAISTLSRHPEVPGIAINLSARSLGEHTLPGYIRDCLKQHKVHAHRLHVELTETAAIGDMEEAIRFIDEIRALGCSVYLDDFGTGFASFAYLRQLNADMLKIDGSFIRDIVTDPESQIVVRGIIQVAKGLGCTVVAEYVASQEILDMLKEMGVDLVQGYHLDQPTDRHPAFNLPSITDTALLTASAA